MGRAEVRAATAAYLSSTVTGLGTVHPAKPLKWKPAEWTFNTATPSTAAGYVHIEETAEARAALGKRHIVYTVAVVLAMKSRHTGQTGGDDRAAAWDALIEGVKAKLRIKPPILGLAPGDIFDAAETLEDESDLPQDVPNGAVTWGLVRFDVHELITG